jgi:hypothetical protein
MGVGLIDASNAVMYGLGDYKGVNNDFIHKENHINSPIVRVSDTLNRRSK